MNLMQFAQHWTGELHAWHCLTMTLLVCLLCVRVAVKELPLVTPADAIKVIESDFKDDNKDNRSVSQDDILFLNMLKGRDLQKH